MQASHLQAAESQQAADDELSRAGGWRHPQEQLGTVMMLVGRIGRRLRSVIQADAEADVRAELIRRDGDNLAGGDGNQKRVDVAFAKGAFDDHAGGQRLGLLLGGRRYLY